MLKDYLKFSFNNLTHRRLRSWLTIIGIFIGIAAVVALISVGQGLQSAITEQFEMLGSNKLIIMPGGGVLGGAYAAGGLTKDDYDVVKKVEGVEITAEMFYKTGKIKFRDEIKNTFVIGLPTDETFKPIKDIQSFQVEKGRDLKEEDKYKITVGWNLWAGDFFSKSIKLRDKIEIEGQEFKVVGLIAKIGNPQDDSQVYIPIDTAREVYNEPDEIGSIFIQVKEGYNIEKVAEDIKEELRDYRGEKEGEETFSIQTFEQLMETFTIIFGIVSAVFIGIAAISLLVGGIGIMNTMYTAVLERTKEIGIMKAIGAKNKDIFILFFIESGLLGLVGGVLGILFGAGIAKLVEFIASQALGTTYLKAIFPWWLIVGVLIFGFIVGSIAGTMPAIQASKMKPVDALRYE